ncbi:MAG: putative glycolipid-binding domain-containing protein [Roseovarius sp.]|uniref:putative glycolipid-binding domain-containing protein n=1 Tax=Roseovarius sp. TaxID=1486281 RepID=UPI0032EC27ED
MTDQVVATARWRALDREGEDTCRLCPAAHGWLLVGHARFRDEGGFAALDYVVRCDADWQTLSADIAGVHDAREVRLRVLRDNGTWLLNEAEQPGLDGAADIDLSFTPATNLMPLRRLLEGRETSLQSSAAWLHYPEPALLRLDQTYARTGQPDVMSYMAEQTDYATQLTFDRAGFVTLYPELWEGEVTHAG